jgi:CRP-like cAMP-binding protein
LFNNLDEEELQRVAESVLFETYGSFDWNVSYKKLRSSGKAGTEHEPAIARQDDYPDGLLMIRAGFARVSVKLGTGERTLSYLGAGDHYGFAGLFYQRHQVHAHRHRPLRSMRRLRPCLRRDPRR